MNNARELLSPGLFLKGLLVTAALPARVQSVPANPDVILWAGAYTSGEKVANKGAAAVG